MFFNRQADGGDEPSGILDPLKRILAAWVALFRTRLEIIATELEEEKIRLGQILALGVISIFLLCMGAITLTFFVIVCFWETEYRLWAAAAFVILYFGAGAGALLTLKKKASKKPKLFSTTLAELAKDEKHLNRQP